MSSSIFSQILIELLPEMCSYFAPAMLFLLIFPLRRQSYRRCVDMSMAEPLTLTGCGGDSMQAQLFPMIHSVKDPLFFLFSHKSSMSSKVIMSANSYYQKPSRLGSTICYLVKIILSALFGVGDI